jgi:hypothetical protein
MAKNKGVWIAKYQSDELSRLIAMATEMGWNGVDNSKLLSEFIRSKIEDADTGRYMDGYRESEARIKELEADLSRAYDVVNWLAEHVPQVGQLIGLGKRVAVRAAGG